MSRIKVWACTEVNNFIFIWYHNKGSTREYTVLSIDVSYFSGHSPNWFPEPIKELINGDKVLGGKMDYYINTNVQVGYIMFIFW